MTVVIRVPAAMRVASRTPARCAGGGPPAESHSPNIRNGDHRDSDEGRESRLRPRTVVQTIPVDREHPSEYAPCASSQRLSSGAPDPSSWPTVAADGTFGYPPIRLRGGAASADDWCRAPVWHRGAIDVPMGGLSPARAPACAAWASALRRSMPRPAARARPRRRPGGPSRTSRPLPPRCGARCSRS